MKEVKNCDRCFQKYIGFMDCNVNDCTVRLEDYIHARTSVDAIDSDTYGTPLDWFTKLTEKVEDKLMRDIQNQIMKRKGYRPIVRETNLPRMIEPKVTILSKPEYIGVRVNVPYNKDLGVNFIGLRVYSLEAVPVSSNLIIVNLIDGTLILSKNVLITPGDNFIEIEKVYMPTMQGIKAFVGIDLSKIKTLQLSCSDKTTGSDCNECKKDRFDGNFMQASAAIADTKNPTDIDTGSVCLDMRLVCDFKNLICRFKQEFQEAFRIGVVWQADIEAVETLNRSWATVANLASTQDKLDGKVHEKEYYAAINTGINNIWAALEGSICVGCSTNGMPNGIQLIRQDFKTQLKHN